MNDETLEALKGSIEKWEKIVAGTGINEGPLNCPLCQMFFIGHEYEESKICRGCPVMEKTGQTRCGGTPYIDYEKSFLDPREPIMKKLAQAELDFLKSLLP